MQQRSLAAKIYISAARYTNVNGIVYDEEKKILIKNFLFDSNRLDKREITRQLIFNLNLNDL